MSRLTHMGSSSRSEISGDGSVLPRSTGRRYEAVLRLSEALSQCREPEDLSKILSEQLREFLAFLQFYIIVYKENSTEVEWAVVGREKSLMAGSAFRTLRVPRVERLPLRDRPAAGFSASLCKDLTLCRQSNRPARTCEEFRRVPAPTESMSC